MMTHVQMDEETGNTEYHYRVASRTMDLFVSMQQAQLTADAWRKMATSLYKSLEDSRAAQLRLAKAVMKNSQPVRVDHEMFDRYECAHCGNRGFAPQIEHNADCVLSLAFDLVGEKT